MWRRHRPRLGAGRYRFRGGGLRYRAASGIGAGKLRKKAVAISAALLVVWLTYYTVVFVKEQIQPPIREMAALAAHQMAAEVINKTLYKEILPGVNYERLVSARQDPDGQLRYLQTDTAALGELVTSAGTAIKENLSPEIAVPLRPMGTVDVNISDSFTQAGINQVKHTIYMEIKTEVRIVIPFMEDIEEVNMRLPLADSVIVGQVPEIYLDGGTAR